ncbi:hypothetical protein IWX81_000361 [Salinibacterium sp. CAN_S4]|uniref:hypothetical protein n=1 Tax=Salinibacterium sp. CAN_S4 TaxID=2787727 RepID=UPI0018EFF98F
MGRISVVFLALLVLTGCATTSSAVAPDGLTLSVYQNRTDVAARKLEVSFLNDTGSVLTVTRLQLTAGQFIGTAVWPKESTTIPAGVTISLPVPLPDPDCTAEPTEAEVEFDYRLADGRAGTAVATPVDTLQRLPGIRQEDCLAVSVASIVTVTMDAAPRVSVIAGRTIAEIDLTLVPTGATGSVTFESASSTTLLTPVSPDGTDAIPAPISRTIAGADEPATVTLLYSPNRCDAHAIAEDKRGTIVPVAVSTTDGFSGPLYVSAADDVRDALYDVVRTACGLPTG